MLKTTQHHIRTIIACLLYYPTPNVIDDVIAIVSEMSDTAGQISWRSIKKALDTVVGRNCWDTALLLAYRLNALEAGISQQLRDAFKVLKAQVLANDDEFNIAAKIFQRSHLKDILNDGNRAEIVTARKEFMVNFVDAMTIVLFFPKRQDFYNMARSKAGLHRGVWLPNKDEDDYFSNSYLRLRLQFAHLFPTNYSALVVRMMSNQMKSSFTPYNRTELLGA